MTSSPTEAEAKEEFTRPASYWEGYDNAKAALSVEKEFRDLDRKYGVVSSGNGKRKSKSKSKEDDDDNKKKECYVQKHSDATLLLESVIVGQRPYFAVSEKIGEKVLTKLEEAHEDEAYKYLPLGDSMSRSYTFKTDEEFYYYIEQAKREDLDSLYGKVKHIWSKYIDADNFHISICAADTIFTYFQDKIGMAHYLFFVGGNDTGKSNNLTVLEYTAYRNFNSVGVTAANIYTFLGNGEEGQGTICEDEADNLDYEYDKMRHYKSGYTSGKKIARTDLPHGERIQNKWNTYCFKAFAAERLPDATKAKGFHQRIIPLLCEYGQPEYDITEIVSSAGEDRFQYLLDELNATHNLLLAYRLLHFHDKISDIKVNLTNREKQLFKPILRIFQHTRALSELLPVISEFVSRRRERNTDTLEAFLYGVLVELFKKHGTLTFDSQSIWLEVKANLQGESIPNKPLSYESELFGTISQRAITEILTQVFGAKKSSHKGDKNRLIFDKDKLKKLERKYAIKVNVKITTNEQEINKIEEQNRAQNGDVGDVWGGSGLDPHVSDNDHDREIAKTEGDNKNNLDDDSRNNQNIITQNDSKRGAHGEDRPQTSPSSPNYARNRYENLIEIKTLPNIGEYFTCKEHPEIPYYSREGIIESHFKPIHSNSMDNE